MSLQVPKVVKKATLTLSVAMAGSCNDTLHDQLVASVNASVMAKAPANLRDNIVVLKGNCSVTVSSAGPG